MPTSKQIEEILDAELKGLCTNCAHAANCAYFQRTSKRIIQCELYTLSTSEEQPVSGLCKTCDLRNGCTLAGRSTGVWHCGDYH